MLTLLLIIILKNNIYIKNNKGSNSRYNKCFFKKAMYERWRLNVLTQSVSFKAWLRFAKKI